MRYNFNKQSSSSIDSLGTKYDYYSVMHYDQYAFGSGRITMRTTDPRMQTVIGKASGFSEIDKRQINLMYKCGGVIPPATQKPVITTTTTQGKLYTTLNSYLFYNVK